MPERHTVEHLQAGERCTGHVAPGWGAVRARVESGAIGTLGWRYNAFMMKVTRLFKKRIGPVVANGSNIKKY